MIGPQPHISTNSFNVMLSRQPRGSPLSLSTSSMFTCSYLRRPSRTSFIYRSLSSFVYQSLFSWSLFCILFHHASIVVAIAVVEGRLDIAKSVVGDVTAQFFGNPRLIVWEDSEILCELRARLAGSRLSI